MDKLSIPTGDSLDVYLRVGSFDQGIAALKREGLELITAEELAEVRVRAGANSILSKEWSWVGENFNYLQNGDVLVASRAFNPLIKYAEEATAAHRNGREFYFGNDGVNDLLDRSEVDVGEAVKSGVLRLSRKSIKSEIPVDCLVDDALTYFLFRDQAKSYGLFLKENGVNSIPVYTVSAEHAKKQSQAFARALWVGNLISSRSNLVGYGNGLGYGGRVRGVRRAKNFPQETKLDKQSLQLVEEGNGFIKYKGQFYVPVPKDLK